MCPTIRVSLATPLKRTGHYTTKCLSKTVAEVTVQMDTLTTTESDHPDDTFDLDTVFLNTVEGDSKYSGTSDNNSKHTDLL